MRNAWTTISPMCAVNYYVGDSSIPYTLLTFQECFCPEGFIDVSGIGNITMTISTESLWAYRDA